MHTKKGGGRGKGSPSDAFSYCSICKRNHQQGWGHVYTKVHLDHLGKVLEKALAKMAEIGELLERPVLTNPDKPGWCIICQKELESSEKLDAPVGYHRIQHLASSAHHKVLDQFWRDCGVEAYWKKTGKTREPKDKFKLTQAEWNQYLARVRKLKTGEIDDNQQTSNFDIHPNEQTNEIFLPASKFTPSSSQISNPSPIGPEPRPLPVPQVPQTVFNQQGIAQNPTGWHEGRRVWGGGIVRYPKSSDQWVPWPIDLLGDGNKQDATTPPEQPIPVRTELAIAQNLTCIKIEPLAEGEGNVHTGATPPWLQGNKGSALKEALDELARKKKEAKNAKNPKRLGADFIAAKRRQQKQNGGTEGGKDWFPSFGGVWNEGPRSEHKRKYLANE